MRLISIITKPFANRYEEERSPSYANSRACVRDVSYEAIYFRIVQKRQREREREMRKFSFRLTSIPGYPAPAMSFSTTYEVTNILPPPSLSVCIRNVSPFAPKSRNNIACSRREVFDTPEVFPSTRLPRRYKTFKI